MPPAYMKTSDMARHIGRGSDFLKERMDDVFLEGVHYFVKPGVRDPFWKVEAMIAWVETDGANRIADEILAKVS